MRYLDPKADMTFKRVFGEHPDLVRSFLNALLPLDEGQEIEEIEYLSPEMVPETPWNKFSIVDVRCRDNRGRQFIVEMQMVWSAEFKRRVLFNASKAYVRQLGRSQNFELLQPVYSLNIVNDLFEPDLQGYYHYYQLVHAEHSDKVIEGLHIVFVELPKYDPQTYQEKKMKVLWLRFLTEIDEKTRQVPEELLDSPEIQKAVTVVEESAFTEAQLLGYDKFWDNVRVEKTLVGAAAKAQRELSEAEKKLAEAKKEIGEAKKEVAEAKKEATEAKKEVNEAKKEVGEAEKRGREAERKAIVLPMIANGMPFEAIAQYTGLSLEEIGKLAEGK
jgi:predicted transposase/invertase (TIGR01784 family)